jgi:hypothetical protein
MDLSWGAEWWRREREAEAGAAGGTYKGEIG